VGACSGCTPDEQPVGGQLCVPPCVLNAGYISDINHHEGMYHKLAEAITAVVHTRAAASGRTTSPDPSISAETGHTTREPGAHTPGLSLHSHPVACATLLTQQQLSEWCPETWVVGTKLLLDMQKVTTGGGEPCSAQSPTPVV
jgi:hypothetical protein